MATVVHLNAVVDQTMHLKVNAVALFLDRRRHATCAGDLVVIGVLRCPLLSTPAYFEQASPGGILVNFIYLNRVSCFSMILV